MGKIVYTVCITQPCRINHPVTCALLAVKHIAAVVAIINFPIAIAAKGNRHCAVAGKTSVICRPGLVGCFTKKLRWRYRAAPLRRMLLTRFINKPGEYIYLRSTEGVG